MNATFRYLSLCAHLAVPVWGSTAPMVTVWRTMDEDRTITLPLVEGFTYDFEADWGDGGSRVRITSFDDPDRTHTYERSDVYTATFTGKMEAWGEKIGTSPPETFVATNDQHQLIYVKDLGDMDWKSLAGAFANCTSLIFVSASDGSFLSEVVDMSFTFL